MCTDSGLEINILYQKFPENILMQEIIKLYSVHTSVCFTVVAGDAENITCSPAKPPCHMHTPQYSDRNTAWTGNRQGAVCFGHRRQQRASKPRVKPPYYLAGRHVCCHFTPLSYFTASSRIKALFSFLFFFFCSGDDYIPVDVPQRDASYVC